VPLMQKWNYIFMLTFHIVHVIFCSWMEVFVFGCSAFSNKECVRNVEKMPMSYDFH
jgi:hypothetical protein